jgi:hypothetical protein
MIKILKSGDNIIPKYIEFNKNFPENHNIKYEKNKGCLIKTMGISKYR